MIPTTNDIQAELASARERLKFVEDSIGRSQTVQRSAVFRDTKKSDEASRRLGRKDEFSNRRIVVAANDKNSLPRSDLDASDLRQRLGRKRTSQTNVDSSNYPTEKRQRTFVDLDNPDVQKGRTNRSDRPANRFDPPISGRPIRRDAENFDRPEGRPRITSHVIAPQDDRTRDDVVKLQGQDKAGKERNRRIFGALLGTLSRFQKEETMHKDQEDRRAQAEKKIEEREKKEKQMMQLRKQELILEKRKQELEVIHLQKKAERIKTFEEWVKNAEYGKNFICTKKKPGIFYFPKVMSKKVQQKLEDSAAQIAGLIMRRQQKLENELLGLDEVFRLKCEDLSRPRTRSENERMELDAEMEQAKNPPHEEVAEKAEEKGENGAGEDLEQPESPKVGESPRLYDQEETIEESGEDPEKGNSGQPESENQEMEQETGEAENEENEENGDKLPEGAEEGSE